MEKVCRKRLCPYPSKRKESGRFSSRSLYLYRPLILTPEPAFHLFEVEIWLVCLDLIHEFPQLGEKHVIPHRLLMPAENLVSGCRPVDSPRLKGSEWGSPPGQGGAPRQKHL